MECKKKTTAKNPLDLKKPLDTEGFCLHMTYAYPAFKSIEKYEEDCQKIKSYLESPGNGALQIMVFCFKNCPYLIQYVKYPLSKKEVEHYWKGNHKQSHNSIKFRDWIIDDVLNLEEFRCQNLSNKCELNELNNCSIIPAYVVKVNKNTAEVNYDAYMLLDGKLVLQKKGSTIYTELIPTVKEGDTISKHHNFGVEIIKKSDAKKIITHQKKLIEKFNQKANLEKMLELPEKILGLLK